MTVFVTLSSRRAIDLFFDNESLQMQQQGLRTDTAKRNKNKKVRGGRLQRIQSIENDERTVRECGEFETHPHRRRTFHT